MNLVGEVVGGDNWTFSTGLIFIALAKTQLLAVPKISYQHAVQYTKKVCKTFFHCVWNLCIIPKGSELYVSYLLVNYVMQAP